MPIDYLSICFAYLSFFFFIYTYELKDFTNIGAMGLKFVLLICKVVKL